MNVTGSISQRFLEISQRLLGPISHPRIAVAACLTAVGIVGIAILIKASDASLNDVVGATAFSCGMASFVTGILVVGNSLNNAIALMFIRFGNQEMAANICNRPVNAFINQHTLGVIAFAAITCAIASFGLTYLD